MRLKLIFILSFLLFSLVGFSQEICFKAYKSADGTMDLKSDGIYNWKTWNSDTTIIKIDLRRDSVFVNDDIFTIIERPKRWVIKKNLKYVSFACGDEYFNKVNVKLYQYDSGEFRVYVMGEKNAKKYNVKYLGDTSPRVLLDKQDVKDMLDNKKDLENKSSKQDSSKTKNIDKAK